MPVLKHAKKKLKQDKNRTLANKKVREFYKSALKKARASMTEKNISAAFSAVDKAVKLNIIHANKAARLKSALTRANKGTENGEKVEKKEAAKPTVKKSAVKKKATKKASK